MIPRGEIFGKYAKREIYSKDYILRTIIATQSSLEEGAPKDKSLEMDYNCYSRNGGVVTLTRVGNVLTNYQKGNLCGNPPDGV